MNRLTDCLYEVQCRSRGIGEWLKRFVCGHWRSRPPSPVGSGFNVGCHRLADINQMKISFNFNELLYLKPSIVVNSYLCLGSTNHNAIKCLDQGQVIGQATASETSWTINNTRALFHKISGHFYSIFMQ